MHSAARRRCGRGEPSPGPDVAGMGRVPAQMRHEWAQSRRRCGGGEPSPGADVGGQRQGYAVQRPLGKRADVLCNQYIYVYIYLYVQPRLVDRRRGLRAVLALHAAEESPRAAPSSARETSGPRHTTHVRAHAYARTHAHPPAHPRYGTCMKGAHDLVCGCPAMLEHCATALIAGCAGQRYEREKRRRARRIAAAAAGGGGGGAAPM